jgi:ABC-2 type transport system ATP-binding protein
VIKAEELTKSFADTTAVDHLTFTAEAGKVTGILGPNGAGKSTTMRLLLGLARPDSGRATIAGQDYRDLRGSPHVVGALLDRPTWAPDRTARDHLLWMARAQRVSARRVTEVTELTGLADVTSTPVGRLARLMSQRLGVAAALLGDPAALMLDEPAAGLDAAGARWMWQLVGRLAAEGRAVLVSASQVEPTVAAADDLVVMSHGRLLASVPAAEFVIQDEDAATLVRAGPAGPLTELIVAAGGRVRAAPEDGLLVSGLPPREIAELAVGSGVLIHELSPWRPTLEDVFADLVADTREPYPGGRGRR